MPIAAVLHLALTIACGVHVIRTGRPYYWIFIILSFPLLGMLIYVLAEVMPDMARSRAARGAMEGAKRIVDPDREYREAKRAVEVSPTVHNRQRLAETCIERGSYDEAAGLYSSCLTGVTKDEPDILAGLARAQFLKGNAAAAVATLDRLREANPDYQSADAHLVYARALEALGRDREALDEYQALAGYSSGEEVRCRLALLLKKLGRRAEADRLFTEIARLPELAQRRYVNSQHAWIDIAREELSR